MQCVILLLVTATLHIEVVIQVLVTHLPMIAGTDPIAWVSAKHLGD